MIEVAMAEYFHLCARESAAINERSVIQLVGENHVFLSRQRRNAADVGQISAAEEEGRLCVLEERKLMLELGVPWMVSRDESRGAAAKCRSLQLGKRRCGDSRIR